METDTIEQVDMKEKRKKKSISDEVNKFLKQSRNLIKGSSPPCMILGTILKMDKEGTQANGLKDKKFDELAQGPTFEWGYRQTKCVEKRRKMNRQLWWLH